MHKSKKYLPVLFCLCIYAMPARGQALLALLFGGKIQNDNISLGIHLALEASDLTNTPSSNLRPGLAFGAYTNVRLKGRWTLSNYFIFKSSRGANAIPFAYQLQPNVPGALDADIARKLTYFEISPLMRYNLTPELSLAAGPQIAIRTIAKDIYTQTLPDGGDEKLVYKTNDYYGRFDIDAAADIQYAFYKGNGVRLNFRFSQGFVNVYKSEVPFSAKNQYFQLGVGIPIPVGKKK
ncbi:porin family protein [Mucilaginibacter agri]|uniref:Outer membrane beta-barrel protein n=1 Tax=Mucilaginibacter agri TaxID=2695265 RepID=A0A966DXK8_9SPHI|nr:outer membrane beta-barrel protein [Mucilaginibacter agri]NCD72369.1 outer membrane beta-barrel protein [Mucilaginibacter agri]